MKDLFERHYLAIVKRGKITPKTSVKQFIEKAHEEDIEALMELPQFLKNDPNNFIQEVVDSIMPKIHMLKKLGIDFETELLKNIEYQETRID